MQAGRLVVKTAPALIVYDRHLDSGDPDLARPSLALGSSYKPDSPIEISFLSGTHYDLDDAIALPDQTVTIDNPEAGGFFVPAGLEAWGSWLFRTDNPSASIAVELDDKDA